RLLRREGRRMAGRHRRRAGRRQLRRGRGAGDLPRLAAGLRVPEVHRRCDPGGHRAGHRRPRGGRCRPGAGRLVTAAESTTQRDAANATSADAATATGAGAGASPPANSTARPSSRPSPGRLAGWVALAVVLLGALAFGTLDDGGARTPD